MIKGCYRNISYLAALLYSFRVDTSSKAHPVSTSTTSIFLNIFQSPLHNTRQPRPMTCSTNSWDIFLKMCRFLLQVYHPPTQSLVLYFFKNEPTDKPKYLFDINPKTNHLCNTGLLEDVTIFYIRTDVFKYSFFLSTSTILERNKLDRRIRQSATMLSFRNALLKIGWPTPKPVYNKHDPNGLKSLLTRLSLGLPISFPLVSHFFLHCHYFTYLRKTLFNELQSVNVDENILISLSNNETNFNGTIVY